MPSWAVAASSVTVPPTVNCPMVNPSSVSTPWSSRLSAASSAMASRPPTPPTRMPTTAPATVAAATDRTTAARCDARRGRSTSSRTLGLVTT